MNSFEALHSILKSIFFRRGKETDRTKIFSSFPEGVQLEFLSDASLEDDELPVVGFCGSQTYRVLVTTKNIRVFSKGDLKIIPISEVRVATVALLEDAKRGALKKTDLSTIKIQLFDGKEVNLEIESGLPFFGIWNILKHFESINTKRKF